MATLWSDNLESAGFTNWTSTTVTGGGSSIAANAASAYAGSYGLDALAAAAGGSEASAKSPSQTITTTFSMQCRFRMHAQNVGTGRCYVLQAHNSGDTIGCNIALDTGPTYKLIYTTRAAGTNTVTLTTQFTLDTWYLLEVLIDWSGANQVYQVYINGVLDSTSTDSSAGSNTVYSRVIGGIYVATATTGTTEVYQDNFYVANAYIGAESSHLLLLGVT